MPRKPDVIARHLVATCHGPFPAELNFEKLLVELVESLIYTRPDDPRAILHAIGKVDEELVIPPITTPVSKPTLAQVMACVNNINQYFP